MNGSNAADFFSKGSPVRVRRGQLLTIFEIKLNGANFLFFSKHVSSPESPGNRPHPLTVKNRGVDTGEIRSF